MIDNSGSLGRMCTQQILRRSVGLGFGVPSNSVYTRMRQEGAKQAAKILTSRKINNDDIDGLVTACRTMANEPSDATLASWHFGYAPDVSASKFDGRFKGLDRADQLRASKYR